MARKSLLPALAALAATLSPIALARPAAPTLVATPANVVFGATVVLKGTIPGGSSGQSVQIFSQACGFTQPVPIGTATTGVAGAYEFRVQPMLNSSFSAAAGEFTSAPAAVKVVPSVQLRRTGPRAFSVDVAVGNGAFFTKAVQLQVLDARTKRWKAVARSQLKAASDPGAIEAVSTGAFHVSVKPGASLRAFVAQSTVGQCYRPAVSQTLNS